MERPSGDQSTCQPSPTLERSTTREPSTSTMDIKCWPTRLELKMIRFPSGDHDGYSPPSVSGGRCCSEPSAFMIGTRVRDLRAVGGPGRREATSQPVRFGSVGVHEPDLLIPIGFGTERDLRSVRGPRGVEFGPG